MYCTNYFLVCIFVYLLAINFVRFKILIKVLIVYFQNIVYSCITITFTVSYVKIAHILSQEGVVTKSSSLLYAIIIAKFFAYIAV